MRRAPAVLALLALAPLFLLAACERELRESRPMPADARTAVATTDSGLRAGPGRSADSLQGLQVPPAGSTDRYDETNAYAIAEGERLFDAYNCSGCHSRGGGGIGPPLMDNEWRYGARPDQVYTTIAQGRPNGMPAFGGRIPTFQVWELVAYVRSMAGLADMEAAPGRQDHMRAKKPENSRNRGTPNLVPAEKETSWR